MANAQALRRLWFKVHKWLGLTLAAPVLIVFVTGSALVWKNSLDDLLHPQRRVEAAATRPPAFYVGATERLLAPGQRVTVLTLPRSKGAVIVTTVVSAPGAGMQGPINYYLHPATGAVLDRGPTYSRLLGTLHVLHGSLFLGRWGGRLVGLVALALLLSAASGLWLWWPVRGPLVRGMRWGRTQDTNANIHHQAGYWVLLPLVVLALTGATISFPRVLPALAGETAATSAEFIRSQAAPLPRPRSNLAVVLASIAVRYPHARLISVIWPTVLDPHWNLSFEDRQAVVSAAVEDGTGTVTLGRSGPPETAARLMRRIHDGTGMPVIWQVLIFASGLFGATLAVTGTLMWVRARARGRRMRGRRSGRTAT